MRRITWVVAIVMCVAVIVAGCGSKDAGAVVKDLNEVMGELTSYQGAGTMTLHTSQQAQEYEVEVWYQAPHYYRIALTNAKKNVTQIVLRNDEGVFVLTPSLNKSFRFQSDWPERQGQAYLYQTLVKSIVDDDNRQFTEDGDAYVFDVASNLQNHSLKRQRVWLHKKDYAPLRMEAIDMDANVLLEVEFDSFTFNNKFDEDSFNMERNMTSFEMQSVPTLAGEEAEGQTKKNRSFGVLKPVYLPEGVTLKDMNDIKLGDDTGVMLRYEGEYNFTLTELRPKDRAVSASVGTVLDLDLGFAVGVLLGNEQMQTLTWVHDGVEFRMSSADLPRDEMVKIAQSMEDQIGK